MFGRRTDRWDFTITDYALMLRSNQVFGVTYHYTWAEFIGEAEPALVGTWIYDNYTNWSTVFNEDGTGRRGTPGEMHTFAWGVAGDALHIRRQGEVYRYVRNEMWYFDATGDYLLLESQTEEGRSDRYTRSGALGEVYQPLVGTWAWKDGIQWTYVFNADGTGASGWAGEQTAFNWGVVDNMLRLEMQGALPAGRLRHERWNFGIDGDMLSLDCLQSDQAYAYVRDGGVGEVALALVGTWHWDMDFDWRYVFEADGTGTFGWYEEPVEFVWGVADDVLRILTWHGALDSWNFDIDEDFLRLEARNRHDVFYYIRDALQKEAEANVSIIS
jgi:hypothetical protein